MQPQPRRSFKLIVWTNSKVDLYEVVVTNDQYPDVFAQPRYKRLPAAIDIIASKLGITIDRNRIIKEDVDAHRVFIKFYNEGSTDE